MNGNAIESEFESENPIYCVMKRVIVNCIPAIEQRAIDVKQIGIEISPLEGRLNPDKRFRGRASAVRSQ